MSIREVDTNRERKERENKGEKRKKRRYCRQKTVKLQKPSKTFFL